MKKVFVLLLAVILVFALAGCDLLDGLGKKETTDEEYSHATAPSDEKKTHSVTVCRTYIATGCLQITNLYYDDYGYPNGGECACFCPFCGEEQYGYGGAIYVFETGGTEEWRSCNNCGKTMEGEIRPIMDTIEVED